MMLGDKRTVMLIPGFKFVLFIVALVSLRMVHEKNEIESSAEPCPDPNTHPHDVSTAG